MLKGRDLVALRKCEVAGDDAMRLLTEGGEDEEMNDADCGDDENDEERLPSFEARPIEFGCSNGDAERKLDDEDADIDMVPLPKSSAPRGNSEDTVSALARLGALASEPSASKRRNAPDARAAERAEGGATISDSSGSSNGYWYPTLLATSASTLHSRSVWSQPSDTN